MEYLICFYKRQVVKILSRIFASGSNEQFQYIDRRSRFDEQNVHAAVSQVREGRHAHRTPRARTRDVGARHPEVLSRHCHGPRGRIGGSSQARSDRRQSVFLVSGK